MRALNDGENQMILDAGQKKYGAIQCSECLMVYHVKDPEDELIHAGMHEIVNDTLKFPVRICIFKRIFIVNLCLISRRAGKRKE